MAKAKSNVMAQLLKKLDNQYASIASDGMVSDITDFIDTGNYALNALLSGSIFKGIASNKVMGLAGKPATGKTYIALGIVYNFLETHEDSIVIYTDSESAVDKEILEARGIDTSRVIYVPVSTVEEFQTQVVAIINGIIELYPEIEDRPKILIVLDSLGLLSTKSEMADADLGENKGDMGRRAKLLKGAFRVLTLKLSKHNIPMIVTNHIYDSMNQYSPAQMSGGSGLQYAAHFITYLTKAKDKEGEGTKKVTVGANITFTLMKGRKSVEGKTITANLNFKSGLDRYSGLFDIAVEGGVFKKEGKQYVLPNKDKLFRAEIEESPELYFTQDILESIDKACVELFTFGGVDAQVAVSEV